MRYRTWSALAGLKALSQPQFKSEMTKRLGCNTTRTNKGTFWPTVRLRRP